MYLYFIYIYNTHTHKFCIVSPSLSVSETSEHNGIRAWLPINVAVTRTLGPWENVSSPFLFEKKNRNEFFLLIEIDTTWYLCIIFISSSPFYSVYPDGGRKPHLVHHLYRSKKKERRKNQFHRSHKKRERGNERQTIWSVHIYIEQTGCYLSLWEDVWCKLGAA